MSRRPAALTLAVGMLLAVAVPAPAGNDPLADARDAVTRLRFTAEVSVEWVDEIGSHRSVLTLQSDRGQVRIDGPGDEAVLWSSGTSLLALPPASRKYEMRSGPGAAVAGRPTVAVEISSGGTVRERLAVDRDSGLVLERVQLDGAGRPLRSVRVEWLAMSVPPVPTTTTIAGQQGRRVAPASLPARYRTPPELPGGYARVGAYWRGEVAHLLYSDGLHGVSVFAQRGSLDGDDLPAGARQVDVGDRTAFAYAWPSGEAVTWTAGGVVYTVVGDGPAEDVLAVARSLPEPPASSMLTRLRQRCRVVAELLLGPSS